MLTGNTDRSKISPVLEIPTYSTSKPGINLRAPSPPHLPNSVSKWFYLILLFTLSATTLMPGLFLLELLWQLPTRVWLRAPCSLVLHRYHYQMKLPKAPVWWSIIVGHVVQASFCTCLKVITSYSGPRLCHVTCCGQCGTKNYEASRDIVEAFTHVHLPSPTALQHSVTICTWIRPGSLAQGWVIRQPITTSMSQQPASTNPTARCVNEATRHQPTHCSLHPVNVPVHCRAFQMTHTPVNNNNTEVVLSHQVWGGVSGSSG